MKIYVEPGAFLPERAHETDAGIDLRAICDTVIPRGGCAVFMTGVHVELPKGTVGMLKSKSGLNLYNGVTTEGVIDEGYTGEIVVKAYNHGGRDVIIKRGDKISQLVVLPVLYADVEQVGSLEELSAGERGKNGFGSTGR